MQKGPFITGSAVKGACHVNLMRGIQCGRLRAMPLNSLPYNYHVARNSLSIIRSIIIRPEIICRLLQSRPRQGFFFVLVAFWKSFKNGTIPLSALAKHAAKTLPLVTAIEIDTHSHSHRSSTQNLDISMHGTDRYPKTGQPCSNPRG